MAAIIFLLFFVSYQVIQVLALPGIIIFFMYRTYKGKPLFGNVAHRFGFIPINKSNTSLWIHAVSVGETLATEYFIQNLKMNDQKVYLTSWTAGAVHVSKQFTVNQRAYLPFDFLPCMLLAFWRIKPKAIIVLEGDWWPNLIMVAKLFGVPVYGLNARITQHTGLRKLFFNIICYALLGHIKKLYTQSEEQSKLFIKYGINPSAIETLGNIKAYNVWAKQKALGISKPEYNYPILMAGSIHPGEAALFFNCFAQLKKQFPTLKLIVVPRHLHWLESCIAMAEALGKTSVLKSKPNETFATLLNEHDIVIGGALGIMFELYAHASLFFLGGTFVPIGGHNLLEPAVWGIASIVGPHHHACVDTLRMLEKVNAASIALNEKELLEKAIYYFSNPIDLRDAGNRAKIWLHHDALVCGNELAAFEKKLKQL